MVTIALDTVIPTSIKNQDVRYFLSLDSRVKFILPEFARACLQLKYVSETFLRFVNHTFAYLL